MCTERKGMHIKKLFCIILTSVFMIDAIAMTAQAETKSELILVDQGYYIDKNEKYGDAIYYWALIKNNNKHKTVESPKIRVAAADVYGNILDTDNCYGHYIAPKDTVVLNGIMFLSSSTEESVDIQMEKPNYVKRSSIPSSAFKTFNVSEIQGDFEPSKVTGELKYTGKKNVSNVVVAAVYKNNKKIVYVTSTELDDIEKDTATVFEIDTYIEAVPQHDSVDIYVQEA